MSDNSRPRIVLLTTDTPHHIYYAGELKKRFGLDGIVIETRALKAPFATRHPFEDERDHFEKSALLNGGPRTLESLAESFSSESVNDEKSVAWLHRIKPEFIFVFGTGKVGPSVIQSAQRYCLNLHGGDPEHYRGLDSHLWTIYHKDFDRLMTTLHCVDATLDTGDIVAQARVPLGNTLKLYGLRAANTRLCVQLSLRALEIYQDIGSIPRRRQIQKGRYYSFMPSDLKSECVKTFERFVETL